MISQIDFLAWKSDPVTRFIFKHLEETATVILENMTSKELIGQPNGLLKLNELRGYVDAIEDFININPIEDHSDENS